MDAIGWVDIALVTLLLVSVVLGLVRGLVFEVLALAGWVVAFFAAQWITPQWSTAVPIGTPGSMVNHVSTFAIVFVATLFVWGLLAWLVKKLVHASALSLLDRLMGAAFGLVRGVLIALVVTLLVTWTPLARSEPWRASHGAALLQQMLQGLKPLMPRELADRLAPR
ncbi:CvpA family protein [Caldimonas sp.]|uniref:CvpA family protein n=1 Tax=Caldimonas sp. TaxID=2838790 RepID=UPI003918A730